jgi:hypothetical protein
MTKLCESFPTTESARRGAERRRRPGAERRGTDRIPLPRCARGARRWGSYADVERILSVTREDGTSVTDDDTARRLLSRARVCDDVARRTMCHLRQGHAVVFEQLEGIDPGTVEELIGQMAVAA